MKPWGKYIAVDVKRPKLVPEQGAKGALQLGALGMPIAVDKVCLPREGGKGGFREMRGGVERRRWSHVRMRLRALLEHVHELGFGAVAETAETAKVAVVVKRPAPQLLLHTL